MNAERIGPFEVLEVQADRRACVRCVACASVSILAVSTLDDKRTLTQQRCAKCRNYVTKTTWTKGVKHERRD